MGFPTDALVVGGSGAIEWRKGPDLFVYLATRLPAKIAGRPVMFLWVGGETDPYFFTSTNHEIGLAGMESRIKITGYTAEPFRYFNLFDVFAMTSRENPFPVVCLEAAALAKPIVCFDSGGIKEFVGEGAGTVVRYPDVAGMASAVEKLLRDPETRRAMESVPGPRSASPMMSRSRAPF